VDSFRSSKIKKGHRSNNETNKQEEEEDSDKNGDL